MRLRVAVYGVVHQVISPPGYNRLQSAIAITQLRLEAMPGFSDAATDWLRQARSNLEAANSNLACGEYEMGWRSLNEADRCILRGTNDPERLLSMATVLRREADSKLSGWRAKAVSDLLCGKDGQLRPDIGDHRDNIVQARWLLDDQFETTNHRIALRRAHLKNLFLFLVLALGSLLALSHWNFLPGVLSDTHALMSMAAAGILGALISVTQSLMQDKLEQKIPAQVIGSFTVWMRPIVGAAAAVALLIVIDANDALKLFNLSALADLRVLLALGLLAGYSERFITGTFDRLSDAVGDKNEKKS